MGGQLWTLGRASPISGTVAPELGRSEDPISSRGAQIPHELNPLYSWATRDVLGSPSTITEDYLKELKESGVICGGGEEEENYRVELPRWGERICELNLEHPRVPHWLWVNEVMFIEFGVRIPFTSFQQQLLQRCFVAPSQFHPNAWSAIRCFELVTEYLELPQDPEVFLFLFIVFSPNAEGKSKKGYMSVRPERNGGSLVCTKSPSMNLTDVILRFPPSATTLLFG
ncbi:hypothetical protein PIB30_014320 [Stylosanthes scabra]|uniref:Uncharacterized protein n=1 Tax=Stylosanthes scabra TaxID=79078 RepID=A0ABU6Q6J7_9FABA|nr:hypothetical protein [Stylosanthes scabra]